MDKLTVIVFAWAILATWLASYFFLKFKKAAQEMETFRLEWEARRSKLYADIKKDVAGKTLEEIADAVHSGMDLTRKE
jgi:hypothetical protein